MKTDEKEVIDSLNELIGYCDEKIKQDEYYAEIFESLNELMGYNNLDNPYQKEKEKVKIKSKKIEYHK